MWWRMTISSLQHVCRSPNAACKLYESATSHRQYALTASMHSKEADRSVQAKYADSRSAIVATPCSIVLARTMK